MTTEHPNKRHNWFMEGRRKGTTVQAKLEQMEGNEIPITSVINTQMAWLLLRVLEESLTLQLSLLFWKPCKEKQQEMVKNHQSRRSEWGKRRVNTKTRRRAPIRLVITNSCITREPKNWENPICSKTVKTKVIDISFLTDVSGSFLPPLLGKFLSLLWAHRICREKTRFQSNLSS